MIKVPLPICFALLLGWSPSSAAPTEPLLPIPDKLVALTFDDGNASDLATVTPILTEHGFGATFYITSGWLGRDRRLDWAQVRKLQEAGFEIGCHTTTHPNLLGLTTTQVERQIADFDRECAARGVRKATSFSYPGGHFDRRTMALLEKHGYRTARRGRDPEFPLEDNGGNGRAYFPGEDDPFLIPSTLTRGISAMDDHHIIRALAQATKGAIAVLTYHGVPDTHPHCSTPVARFRADLKSLKDSGATVVALRDLSRYIDFSKRPKDAFAPIVRRLGLRAAALECDSSRAVPHFSWKLETSRWTQQQVAYRILVASSRTHLDRDHGDLWDSGKVSDHRTAKRPANELL